jgi:DUF4097 and DUF4098 domain-containing protein YvlB
MNPLTTARFPLASLALLLLAAPLHGAVTARQDGDGRAVRVTFAERYAEARQGPEQSDAQTHRFRVGADGALDLTNISGDVRVTGDGGQEIRIEAVKRVRHRDPDTARQLLGQLRIDVTQVGNRIEVRTTYPRRSGGARDRDLAARVDYTVSVPSGAAVAIKTISGDTVVTRVTGDVRAETVSGNVEVTGAPGLSVARTVSGNVTVRDVGNVGTVALSTVSGNVSATGVRARAVECGAVSGDLILTGIEAERLQAKTVSGDIEFGARLARGGRYEFGSHSGDVRITLASDTGFELDASTFNGSVRSDFPIALRSNGGAGGRRESTRTVRGSFGDASAVLSVKSFSGTVVIGRR